MPTTTWPKAFHQRRRLEVTGTVQGVGFRPFVYRLAEAMGLSGWVQNRPQGVVIEVEGTDPVLEQFQQRLVAEAPPHSRIDQIQGLHRPAEGGTGFVILPSGDGPRTTAILPDLAPCPACLAELAQTHHRRYRYPFTNCTHCGPRFSILLDLPYDRPHTTLAGFRLCPSCQAEYDDPHNRRFHAQPTACPVCGPHLALWDTAGRSLAQSEAALQGAEAALRAGHILALKGLGGFLLLADARNPNAVQTLRQRKHRPAKPLALLYPNMALVKAHCLVSPAEATVLQSAAAPIVLLRRRSDTPTDAPVAAVAPDSDELGVMLPSTPLHHLLSSDLGFPLVATSGNRPGEPICIDETQALVDLAGLADLFLVHNRPIARPVDDSVVRVIAGRPTLLRRARGYAPQPLRLPVADHPPLIAVGGHGKNTVAIAAQGRVILSQHLGDLETAAGRAHLRHTLADLQRLYALQPVAVACDAHPDYGSTALAHQLNLPVIPVPHHLAHVLAAVVEHALDLTTPLLGVAWDGLGYGPDGGLWGGEWLAVTDQTWHRVAHLRPFPLPGGALASREPRRSALGLLYAWGGRPALAAVHTLFTPTEWQLLTVALDRSVNCPPTSSIGRLFDAVAALLGLHSRCSYEGQAALDLETLAHRAQTTNTYPLQIETTTAGRLVDWGPLLTAIQRDKQQGICETQIAAMFHNTLAEMIVNVAQLSGYQRVILTGGCFQNKYLTEQAIYRLHQAGFQPYWPGPLPPNDGGLAIGQILGCLRVLTSDSSGSEHCCSG